MNLDAKKIEFLSCYMSYLASNLIFSLKNAWKIQYKPIEICHMENVVFRKDFNLSTASSLFHVFSQMLIAIQKLNCKDSCKTPLFLIVVILKFIDLP